MGFCDIPVVDKACDAAGNIQQTVTDPAGLITDNIGAWFAKSAGEFAGTCADLAAQGIDTTTRIDLNTAWFHDNYAMILPIGLVMLVATFSAQLTRAAIRRDGRALSQAVTGTITGVLFSFSAIALTTIAIQVTDALSDGLFSAGGTSLQAAVRRMITVAEFDSFSGLGWMVTTVTELATATGAILFWCVMMVRKVGILVMVTLAPLAASGGGWEAARRWRKGWIEATATLVASKLLMTIIFLLGLSAMGRTQTKDGMGALADCMSGIVIMLLVLLCPYAVFKFVHWASEGTDAESIHRAGGTGATTAREHTERAARKAASAMSGGAGGAAAGASASPQGPATVPGQGPGGIAQINPTGPDAQPQAGQGSSSGASDSPSLAAARKLTQPHPTSPTDDTSQQAGGTGQTAETGSWDSKITPTTGQITEQSPSSASGTQPPPAGT